MENSKSFDMGLFWLGFSVFGVTSFFCRFKVKIQVISRVFFRPLELCLLIRPFSFSRQVHCCNGCILLSLPPKKGDQERNACWNQQSLLWGLKVKLRSLVQTKSFDTDWPPHPDPPPQPWPQPRLATFNRVVTKVKTQIISTLGRSSSFRTMFSAAFVLASFLFLPLPLEERSPIFSWYS